MELAEWLLKASLTKSKGSNTPIDLGNKFSKPSQLIKLTVPNQRSTWNYGGKLYAANKIAGKTSIFATYDLNLNYQQVIVVPLIIPSAFSLLYLPPKWFSKFTIKIYENQKMPLYSSSANNIVASSAEVKTVSVANSTAPVAVLPVNLARKRYSLRNKGNKSIAIGFTNTFTVATAFMTLTPGDVYESDIQYTGEIWALTLAANGASDLVVTEFL